VSADPPAAAAVEPSRNTRLISLDREARTDRHTVHVVANPVTTETSNDTVEVSALIMLHVRNAEGGYALERVLDTVHRFRSTACGWKIVSRTSTPLHAAVPAA